MDSPARTLQNREQGRTRSCGAAQMLIRVTLQAPKALRGLSAAV